MGFATKSRTPRTEKPTALLRLDEGGDYEDAEAEGRHRRRSNLASNSASPAGSSKAVEDEVGPRGEGIVHAAGALLRRHVGGRAGVGQLDGRSRFTRRLDDPREAEVDEDGAPVSSSTTMLLGFTSR